MKKSISSSSSSLSTQQQNTNISNIEDLENLHTYYVNATTQVRQQNEKGEEEEEEKETKSNEIPTINTKIQVLNTNSGEIHQKNIENTTTNPSTGYKGAFNSPFGSQRQSALTEKIPRKNNTDLLNSEVQATDMLNDIVTNMLEYISMNEIDEIRDVFKHMSGLIRNRIYFDGKKQYIAGTWLMHGKYRHSPLQKFGNDISNLNISNTTTTISEENLKEHELSPLEWNLKAEIYDENGQLRKTPAMFNLNIIHNTAPGYKPINNDNNEKGSLINAKDLEDVYDQVAKEREIEALELQRKQKEDQTQDKARRSIIYWFEQNSTSFKFACLVAGGNLRNNNEQYIKRNLPNDVYKFWSIKRKTIRVKFGSEDFHLFTRLDNTNINAFMEKYSNDIDPIIIQDQKMEYLNDNINFAFESIFSFILTFAVREAWMIIEQILLEVYKRNPYAPGFKTYSDYIPYQGLQIPDIRLVFSPKHPQNNIYFEFIKFVSQIINKNQMNLPNEDISKQKALTNLNEFDTFRKIIGVKLYHMGFYDQQQYNKRF